MTDIWVLYHQTGPDGQEWGVKIRPGYVVTGFTREDAEAVVTWQNASCRPASDILERAKAAISYEIFYDHDEVELVRLLIAEVEASRNMVREFQNHEDQTHAEMEKIVGNSDNFIELTRQLKEEVERLRSAPKSGLYGKYIIQKTDGSPVDPHADYFVMRLDTDPYARIAALEYAIQTDDQTLGEMLKKRVIDHVFSEDDQCRKRAEAWPLGMIKKLREEVERLQDFRGRIARILGQSEGDCDDLLVLGLGARIIRNKRQATRIEELEAIRGQFYRHINRERGRVRFAFNQSQELILARARIKELEAEKERLEAAFLEAEERVLWDEVVVEGPKEGRAKRHIEIVQQKAREKLEKIRSGEQ